tara:strand:+ start:895 stop:1095 length:201 start_codon:yes stop_codon:yes gene_type:complete
MSKISPQLLENDWETYTGFKNFLGDKKELSFGDEMNSKYSFKDDKLLELSDRDAYDYIKQKHIVNT